MTDTYARLRTGLHDSANTVRTVDLVAGALQQSRRLRRRRQASAALTVAALVGLGGGMAVGLTGHGTTGQPAVTRPSPSLVPPIAPFTPPPTAPTAPSQSGTDARRDHVLPEIAALAVRDRVDPVVVQDGPDGAWVVSRLPEATAERMKPAYELAGSGLAGKAVGTIAPLDYGELLLMDPKRTHILRAFPLPALVPQALRVTAQDVWVAHVGDEVLPDSMVGHWDRRHHEWVVMVYPSVDRSEFNSGPGGVWTGPEWLLYEGGHPAGTPQTPVTLTGPGGVSIRVQPQWMRILGH